MGKYGDNEALEGARLSYTLISRLIYSEPQLDEIRFFADEGTFEDAPFGKGNEHVDKGLSLLAGWCASAARGDLSEGVEALKREWLMLFIGAGTPKAPLWESYYTEPNNLLFGESTLAVRAWYRRYGLQAEKQKSEPDDNLGIMLGFLGHLITLEEDAISVGDTDTMVQIRKAQQEFLCEHILPWLPAWFYQVSKCAVSDFYRGVGELVFGTIQTYAERFGVMYRSDTSAFVRTVSDSVSVL